MRENDALTTLRRAYAGGSAIRTLAGPTVTVLGSQPFNVLRRHYAHCRALIFPGEEDFGIVPVEAMVCGRPVIAYGRGGATETVTSGGSGLFFQEQTATAIKRAILEFEQMHFDAIVIKGHAEKFDLQRFTSEIIAALELALGYKLARGPGQEWRRVAPKTTSASLRTRN